MSCRPSRSARRLMLEPLEPRLALTTFYVSNLGADTGSGSQAAPWATLQKAANTVQAGDTVIVRSGNYVGFHMTRDGTATARITFQAEPGAAVTQRNATTPDGINLEGADYVTIDGFAVNGMPRAGIRSVTNHDVIIRNNHLDQNYKWGILTGFSDDLLIENNVASRSQVEHGIYVSNSGDRPVIRGNTIWGNNANGIHMNGDASLGGDGIITGALVENNVIYDNGLGGGSGINGDGVQDSVFRNNLLYDNHASGISLYQIDGGGGSTGNVIVNNTVIQASNGRWALNIQSGSTGNTVRN
ncbi:MAG TPA: right-handed parallel beta-helix repeat-containing protein, partial [Pirellulaceae bacterium]|nr:right-handed parallel beta-helix repeat-containing protein [Pirellulaceae bacterium]